MKYLFKQQKNNTTCPAFLVLDLFYIMLLKEGKNKKVKVIVKFSIKMYCETREEINLLHIFLIFFLYINRTNFYLAYSDCCF